MSETEDTTELQRRREHEAAELRRKIKRELESILRDLEPRKYRGFTRNHATLQWVLLMLHKLQRLERE